MQPLSRGHGRSPSIAEIGYAANPRGLGVAYVRTESQGQNAVLRVPFRVQSGLGLFDRQVGYAALAAVVKKLEDKGMGRVVIRLDDDSLIEDVQGHREVPAALSLSYIRLGCALNALAEYRLETGADNAQDLTARARAEVHLAAAA